jgi:hypothetical protein
MPSTAGKPVTAGPPATAFSKGAAETPTTPLVTPGMSAIAERPATFNHQELRTPATARMSATVGCKQQQ